MTPQALELLAEIFRNNVRYELVHAETLDDALLQELVDACAVDVVQSRISASLDELLAGEGDTTRSVHVNGRGRALLNTAGRE